MQSIFCVLLLIVMVVERSNVLVRLFFKPFASERESSCFQFSIHPNSKHKKMWMSMEGSNCKVFLQEESTMSHYFLQLDVSEFCQHSYPLSWDLLPLKIKAPTKDCIVKDIISKAYRVLFGGGRPKLYKRWLLNLRIVKFGEEECCSDCLSYVTWITFINILISWITSIFFSHHLSLYIFQILLYNFVSNCVFIY